jgi:lipoprotein-anchoring transpeptidase ErfK/SrfK
MTYPKLFVIVAGVLLMVIGTAALLKDRSASTARPPSYLVGSTGSAVDTSVSIALETEVRPMRAPISRQPDVPQVNAEPKAETRLASAEVLPKASVEQARAKPVPPEANRIEELFNRGEPRLPFVETVVYSSSVPWKKGRAAWLADYANHYATSRHFIARSLNGKADYLRQEVANGDRFNVFRKDRDIAFHLLVDLNRQKMWFYAIDSGKHRTLLKTYPVGLGRPDSKKASGFLTPIGKYLLGNRVAIYQPKVEGVHKGKRIEMMRVFGMRWIPFDKELENCSEPAKGFGLHGLPWNPGSDGHLKEDRSSLGRHEGDGCIRLADEDIKELFAIVLTKPTTVEIVKDYYDASLPGSETGSEK